MHAKPWDELTEQEKHDEAVAHLAEVLSKPCRMCGAGPFSGAELLSTPLLFIPPEGLVLFCSTECAQRKDREIAGALDN